MRCSAYLWNLQILFCNFIKIGRHLILGSILKYLKEIVSKYTRSAATAIHKHV